MGVKRRKSRYRRKGSAGTGPNLTPMMDMFTIILVFLLKSYSVSYVGLKPRGDVTLPQSISTDSPERMVAVDISANGIYVENTLLQPLDNFVLPTSVANQQTLFGIRTLVKDRLDRGVIDGTVAVIRADQQTPFDILWRIMFTLRQLGFEDFQNLVIKKTEST